MNEVERNVLERYSEGAQIRQEALCCSVEYDQSLLTALPQEIIEKDYGCGDPSRYVRSGDVVLDLGSGGGKIGYMAAQLVGEHGRVIGIDMNDDMLALARKCQPEMARRLGQDRVSFHRGYIQDLALDLDALDAYLQQHPVHAAHADYQHLRQWEETRRREHPLIADESVDLVISNCVLNLVRDEDKAQLVREIHRVLKPGGRVAVSNIVSDEVIPVELKQDPELWSGCISGAFQEEAFLQAFAAAGFLAVAYDTWDTTPWQVVNGIEFRSVTLTAVKGQQGEECLDRGHAVIYRGPHAEVQDDEGHVFPRGARMAVSERTYTLLTGGSYGDDFIGIAPGDPAEPHPWRAPVGTRRPASESKGALHAGDSRGGCCCG